MARRTKIVATIGPASQAPEMIEKLMQAGVNVFRLNFSHGTPDDHRRNAATIKQCRQRLGIHAALLGDLQGPKIRIGDLTQNERPLTDGERITLSTAETMETGDIPVAYKPLPNQVVAGDTLLLDDGLLRLIVEAVDQHRVHCKVVNGGILKSRKGINRLGGGLSAPAITEKDFQDIALAAELDVDYIAVSFPSSADDLLPVREALSRANADIHLIAKIERAELVADEQRLRALIQASDGVMVARGDLGVEIGDPQLIGVQKKIIKLARRLNRPVITATQMMESMVHAPIPTRAEVFDVANAVLDKTDAVMLSAETATGKHPDRVVRAMSDTCVGAEQHPATRASTYRVDQTFSDIDEMIAMSAIYAANHIDRIAAIICMTESGRTALFASRLSTGLPIFGISRHEPSCRRMALYRGVIPVCMDISDMTLPEAIRSAVHYVADSGFLGAGQRVCVTYGETTIGNGITNTLKIIEYSGAGMVRELSGAAK